MFASFSQIPAAPAAPATPATPAFESVPHSSWVTNDAKTGALSFEPAEAPPSANPNAQSMSSAPNGGFSAAALKWGALPESTQQRELENLSTTLSPQSADGHKQGSLLQEPSPKPRYCPKLESIPEEPC